MATSNREAGNNNISTVGPVVQVRVQPAMPAQDTFIYCHKCGTKLNANTQFCHKCGTKVAR